MGSLDGFDGFDADSIPEIPPGCDVREGDKDFIALVTWFLPEQDEENVRDFALHILNECLFDFTTPEKCRYAHLLPGLMVLYRSNFVNIYRDLASREQMRKKYEHFCAWQQRSTAKRALDCLHREEAIGYREN